MNDATDASRQFPFPAHIKNQKPLQFSSSRDENCSGFLVIMS